MDNTQLIKHSKTWDRTGVIIATLCLIHCIALPFIILLAPTLKFFLESLLVEMAILVSGVLVGSISFYTSYKKHRKFGPMTLGTLGVLFLFANIALLQLLPPHSHEAPAGLSISSFSVDPLMILGGLFLISGHLWNIRECHCFCDHSCSHEQHSH